MIDLGIKEYNYTKYKVMIGGKKKNKKNFVASVLLLPVLGTKF